jgi:hypothetical protein
MCTKKDYIWFANFLKQNYAVSNNGCKAMLRDMADQLCQHFAADNPNFDRTRFMAATIIHD